MKKKFLAILLGALMLVSMIPATGMASTEASAALVPNGDFESALVNHTVSQVISDVPTSTIVEVPADGWTVRTDYRNPISGMFSAADLTELGAPAGTESTTAWKIERTALEGSSAVMYAHYETFTNNLENGKWYKVEYFYNIPEALTDGAKFVLSMPSAVGRDGTNYGSVSFSTADVTDGWVKKIHYFQYDSSKTGVLRIGMSGAGGGGVAYIDELKVTEYVTNNILPNGEFEFDFASTTTSCVDGVHTVAIPYAGWRFAASYRPTLLVNPEKVSSPTASANSGFAMKLEKAAGGHGNATGNHVVYDISSSVLDVGDVYKLEYSYNIPTAMEGVLFQGGFWGADFSTNATAPYNSAAVSTSAATDGWAKKEFVFKYNGTNLKLRFGFRYDIADAGVGLAYVDDVKLVKIADFAADSLLSQDGSFEADKAVQASGDFITHGSANASNYQVVADPADASNTVLYQLKNSAARGVINVPVKSNAYTTDDFFKTTFRFYVKADETPAASFNIPVQLRIDGQTRSANYIACPVTVQPSQFNAWHTAEIYHTAIEVSDAADRQLVIINNESYDIYFDDFDVVPYTPAASYVDLNTNGYRKKLTNHSTSVQDTFFSYAFGKNVSAPATIAANATIHPFVAFAPAAPAEGEAVTKNALAILAIYETEGGIRTLKDVVIKDVSALEGDVAVSPSLSYELSGVDSANYEVECYLWDTALSPLANAAMPIAAPAA